MLKGRKLIRPRRLCGIYINPYGYSMATAVESMGVDTYTITDTCFEEIVSLKSLIATYKALSVKNIVTEDDVGFKYTGCNRELKGISINKIYDLSDIENEVTKLKINLNDKVLLINGSLTEQVKTSMEQYDSTESANHIIQAIFICSNLIAETNNGIDWYKYL